MSDEYGWVAFGYDWGSPPPRVLIFRTASEAEAYFIRLKKGHHLTTFDPSSRKIFDGCDYISWGTDKYTECGTINTTKSIVDNMVVKETLVLRDEEE